MKIFYPVARILLALIFVLSGYGKIMHFAGTAAFMGKMGVPMATAALVAAIIIELGGGIMVMLGYQVRWAAGIMFLYVIPITYYVHRHDQIQILKNISIMGGLLLLVAGGAGACSVDKK
jgi:putative oxidoreductase